MTLQTGELCMRTSWVNLTQRTRFDLPNQIERLLERWGITVEENQSTLLDFVATGQIPWVFYDAQNPSLAVAPHSTPAMFEIMQAMVESGTDLVAVVNRPKAERIDVYHGPMGMIERAVPEIFDFMHERRTEG